MKKQTNRRTQLEVFIVNSMKMWRYAFEKRLSCEKNKNEKEIAEKLFGSNDETTHQLI